jgi:hypothetical protein
MGSGLPGRPGFANLQVAALIADDQKKLRTPRPSSPLKRLMPKRTVSDPTDFQNVNWFTASNL